jgi:para-aminobenzoate synthetase
MPPLLARDLLGPLAVEQVAHPPRWSWVRDAWVPGLAVEPGGLLVLDGCGSGSRPLRPYLSAVVWVEAAPDVRHRRAMARDGATFAPWWDVWAEQERRLFAAEGTRAAADVVVRTDGSH